MASATAFRARPGDEVVIHGHAVGSRGLTGEILEVLGEPGYEHYRVRWEDGHESIHYPGSDARVVHRPRRRRPARNG